MANYSPNDDHYLYYRVKMHGLTEDQKRLIERLSDIRRFTYNWFLEYSNDRYEKYGERFQGYKRLSNKITELRNSNEYSWLRDYNLCVMRGALKDLSRGFIRFWNGQNRCPKFKSKKTDHIRFESRADRFYLCGENGRYAFIPGLSKNNKDLIDLKNHKIPFNDRNIKYRDVHVVFDGHSYWLCVTIKPIIPITEIEPYVYDNDIVGIDLGIRTAATLSNGKTYDCPDKHRLQVLFNRRDKMMNAVARDRHKRLKQSIRTRTKYEDIPKSKNQLKRESKLTKTIQKITNIYKTRYHQIASDISNQKYSAVVLETLRIKSLLSINRGELSHQLYESRLYTLGSYIEYKCRDIGTIVIRANDGYKSSQICSSCGHEYNIGKEKIYTCPNCDLKIDRDINAAINLRNYGISYVNQNPSIGYSTYWCM